MSQPTATALITGASQGTGRATALQFVRQGYAVALAARQPDRLQSAKPSAAIAPYLFSADWKAIAARSAG